MDHASVELRTSERSHLSNGSRGHRDLFLNTGDVRHMNDPYFSWFDGITGRIGKVGNNPIARDGTV